MWFNSTLSEEPYQGLTWYCKRTETCDLRGCTTGAAWLSSARVVRCTVKSGNERNPYDLLFLCQIELPRLTGRKVGMTSSQHGPYVLGDTRATMGCTTGRQAVTRSKSYQNTPQFRLRAETRPHEAGIASNRGSASPR